MSYILSIYSKKAFHEYLLPAIDNADFTLNIKQELFDLRQSVDISMEIIDGKWKFQKPKGYKITYTATKEEYQQQSLKDKDIFSLHLNWGEQISLVIREEESFFGVYTKYYLPTGEVTIGKGEENTFCYSYLELISKIHARVIMKDQGCVVEDLSTNGVFVNGKRVMGSHRLEFGDCVDIFGFRLVYLKNLIAVNTKLKNLNIRENNLKEFEESSIKESKQPEEIRELALFNRSPRNVLPLEKDKVEIEGPPSPGQKSIPSTLMAIGPTLTMSLPMMAGTLLSIYGSKAQGVSNGRFMYTGLVTALGSALVGSFWTINNLRLTKKRNREEELRRFETYSEYLIKCSNDIKQKYERNTEAMHKMYLSPESVCNFTENSLELWNRNIRHEDFLFQRLGIGDLPFQVQIDVPKSRFTMGNDSLAEKPGMIKESYKTLHNVPVGIDLLKHNIIGIIGGKERKGCYPVLHTLVAQLAGNNCYTDVKLAFIYSEENSDNWKFAKWLPHVWSEDKRTRYVAGSKTEAGEVFYDIAGVIRKRAEDSRSSGGNKKEIITPHYVVFLESPAVLEDELIAKYLLDPQGTFGITTLMMVEDYHELPNECEYIIENTGHFSGIYDVSGSMVEKTKIAFDQLVQGQLENFARKLSTIKVKETQSGGEIPNVLTFFDMYNISHPHELEVMERWKKNRTYENIKALVGQKSGGVDCYLDVHEKYHGPHGLVAGTTGSGKSETLQTYLLSLAINFSPDDIGFFIIDYKGGGMANLFEGLPHLIGQISNLSGNQVRRAMVSIKSENQRRQRIFNEHGVNNINLYTRLFKNKEASVPIPHLFIIIDEFAELKREEPEFMRELISVAQVGRSLGVHLILATQKPSGTVDDNIWSNSKFRLCLRVQDRQDSTDMLHRPDAAYITQAGRCYLQVGNDELFELFQSAWSGAVYDEEIGNVQADIAKMLSDSGKAALVGSYAKIQQKEKAKKAWISLLLSLLDRVAEKEEREIQECLYDMNLRKRMVEVFFDEAEEKIPEYTASDYNIHRITELLMLYAKVIEKAGKGTDREEIVASVLRLAVEKGVKLPEMKEKTQLDAVVEYLGKVAVENGYINNLKLWLPVLPVQLYLSQLEGYEKNSFHDGKWPARQEAFSLSAAIGKYDDPVNQAQGTVEIDQAIEGNIAVIGTVVSGKSTFLTTYAYSLTHSHTPEEVNLYIIDYSSKMLDSLKELPHVGGIMYEEDQEKTAKFFHMLGRIVQERKKMFKGGNYSQYIQANGLTVPSILILIDNFGAFRNKTNFQYDEQLMSLLKEGIGYGIYLVVTASGFGMNEIPSRMGEGFRKTICLELNDKFAYSEALRTTRVEVLPEQNVKGRGIIKMGDAILEFQTALIVEAEDEYKRGEKIRESCHQLNLSWDKNRARTIPEIPQKPVSNEFFELNDVNQLVAQGEKLPIGYDKKSADIYGIDLRATYCYLISGKARTGKSNVIKLAIQAAQKLNGLITVIDFSGALKATAEHVGAEYISTTQELYQYFLDISPDFKARNVDKKQLEENGKSNEEIFRNMQKYQKRFIFIDNLPEFAVKVDKPGEGVSSMSPFVSTLLDKGAMHNVFWFAGYNQEEASKAAGLRVMELFVRDKRGMHLGGNVASQRLLPFDHISYNQQNKSRKPGIGMLAMHDEDATVEVVLPMYKSE